MILQRTANWVSSDPLRPKHLGELRRLITELREEAKQKGLDKITMREINAEIAATRRARRKKKQSKQSMA